MTPDAHPIIGWVEDGVYVACGFSGHGFQHSPATGRLMAELILDGRTTTFDLSLLNAERFAHGRLVGARYGYSVLG
jgi:sarcosine oxidase subunit beta